MGRTLSHDLRHRFSPRQLYVLAAPVPLAADSEAFAARVTARWERAAEHMLAHLLQLEPASTPSAPALEVARASSRLAARENLATPGRRGKPKASTPAGPVAAEFVAAGMAAWESPGRVATPAVALPPDRDGLRRGRGSDEIAPAEAEVAATDATCEAECGPSTDRHGKPLSLPAPVSPWDDASPPAAERSRRPTALGLGGDELAAGTLPSREVNAAAPFGVEALFHGVERASTRRRRPSSVAPPGAERGVRKRQGSASRFESEPTSDQPFAVSPGAELAPGPGESFDVPARYFDYWQEALRQQARLREWRRTSF